jgi:hypothetical protein
MKTAEKALKRLATMHTVGGWWAFRNLKIKSSVPDMYRHTADVGDNDCGAYVVVHIDEWSQHCTVQEVCLILKHWIQVGSLTHHLGLDIIPQFVLDVVHRTLRASNYEYDNEYDDDVDLDLDPPPSNSRSSRTPIEMSESAISKLLEEV